MTEFALDGDFAILGAESSFTFPLDGDFSILSGLPSFTLALSGDFVISTGAIVFMKIGEELVELPLRIKQGGVLIDPDPYA